MWTRDGRTASAGPQRRNVDSHSKFVDHPDRFKKFTSEYFCPMDIRDAWLLRVGPLDR